MAEPGFRRVKDSELSYLRNLCDEYLDPRDYECGGGTTRFKLDRSKDVKLLAELALNLYNEKEQKNFYVEKVGMLNVVFGTYYCMTFWARDAESDVRPLFRGVVDLYEGDDVLLCEIKDGHDEITIPDGHDEDYLEKHPPYYWVGDELRCGYDDALVDANHGSAVDDGGEYLGSVAGSDVAEGSLETETRNLRLSSGDKN